MAMTKKERAELEALETEVALRWPRYEMPANVPPPKWEPGQGLTILWTINAFTGRVTRGCTDGHSHNRDGVDRATSQRPAPPEGWYETKAEALRALRIRMSEQFAEKLAAVDRQIRALEREAPMGEDKGHG